VLARASHRIMRQFLEIWVPVIVPILFVGALFLYLLWF
jgi:hypothetical protein